MFLLCIVLLNIIARITINFKYFHYELHYLSLLFIKSTVNWGWGNDRAALATDNCKNYRVWGFFFLLGRK